MMSGRRILLSVAFLFVLVIPAAMAPAAVYNAWDANPGTTWHDVDKSHSNYDDDLLCWAAAASNILDWGGWTTSSLPDNTAIWQDFQYYWYDMTGWMNYGWDWYMNGTTPPPKTDGSARIEIAGGGNYFPAYDYIDYFHQWGHLPGDFEAYVPYAMENYLRAGYGVTLAIRNSYSGHALTVWGIEYDEADPDRYTGIYVTDSDDYLHHLVYYQIYFDSDTGRYRFSAGTTYSGYWFWATEALARKPSAFTLPPITIDPILPYLDPQILIPPDFFRPVLPFTPLVPLNFVPDVVPEPGSLLLVFAGIAGLAVRRLKR